MKKNYIAPSVEITNVVLQQMIAGSKDVTVDGLEGFDGYGGDGTGKTPSSRRRNIWEDDEEDF
jgi:hypothetical protein